jgi:hypothetical protein
MSQTQSQSQLEAQAKAEGAGDELERVVEEAEKAVALSPLYKEKLEKERYAYSCLLGKCIPISSRETLSMKMPIVELADLTAMSRLVERKDPVIYHDALNKRFLALWNGILHIAFYDDSITQTDTDP